MATAAPRSSGIGRIKPLDSILATAEKKKKTTPEAFDADGRPVAPANAPKKHLPMDWLID